MNPTLAVQSHCAHCCATGNLAHLPDNFRELLQYKISVLCETRLKLKFREILIARNILLRCQMVVKFCTEHGSITAVLCANFQNDLTIEIDVLKERHFVRFEFKLSFKWISCITTAPRRSNSLWPSETIWSQTSRSTWIQVMAWHLQGTKPLPKLMLIYCQLDPWEQNFSEIWIKIQWFLCQKMHLKMLLAKWQPFYSGFSFLWLPTWGLTLEVPRWCLDFLLLVWNVGIWSKNCFT